MRTHRLLALSFLCMLFPAVVASCSGGGGGGGGGDGGSGGSGGSGGDSGGSGGGGSLTWYTTCGDPVCGGPGGAGGSMAPDGVDACTTEKEGDACSTEGARCWPGPNSCGALLQCATSDPKGNPPNCPISQARYKKDIEYLPESGLQRVHDDLMAMRLATWLYTSEPVEAREHLGFIIDDSPASPAVKASGVEVDLYGYTSMAVAAAQVHDKRIDALERELSTLREELASLRAQGRCEPAR